MTPVKGVVTAAAAAAAHAAATHAAAAGAAHAAAGVATHAAAGHAAASLAPFGLFGAHGSALPLGVQAVGYSALGASPLVTAVAVEGLPDATQILSLPPSPPSRAAVARILQIEFERLVATIRQGGKPAHVIQRVKDTAEMRSPIIRWALNLWMQRALGMDTPGMWCPALKSLPILSRPTPRFGASLRVLEDELTEQVKFGFRTAPLLAVKLAYRAVIVALVAIIGRWPGFQWLRARLKKTWPGCVDALAATIERNHAALVSSGFGSIEAVRQKEREMRRNMHRRIGTRILGLQNDARGLWFRVRRALFPHGWRSLSG